MGAEHANEWISPECAARCPFFLQCDVTEAALLMPLLDMTRLYRLAERSAQFDNVPLDRLLADPLFLMRIEEAGLDPNELIDARAAGHTTLGGFLSSRNQDAFDSMNATNGRLAARNEEFARRFRWERHNVGATCSAKRPTRLENGAAVCRSGLGRAKLAEGILRLITTRRLPRDSGWPKLNSDL